MVNISQVSIYLIYSQLQLVLYIFIHYWTCSIKYCVHILCRTSIISELFKSIWTEK